jgi:hypothetical protein
VAKGNYFLSFFCEGRGNIVAMDSFFMQLVYRDVAFSWHAETVFFFFREKCNITCSFIIEMQSDGSLAAWPTCTAGRRDAAPSWNGVVNFYIDAIHNCRDEYITS